MHLFYENLVKNLCDHYHGKFFDKRNLQAQASHDPVCRSKFKANKKFIQTDDPHCIFPSTSEKIGKDMDPLLESMPAQFVEPIHSIASNCLHYKTLEWK